MGASVHVRCKCGYQADNLPIGGGMSDFQFSCSFPVFCTGCQRLVLANLLDTPPTCPDCRGAGVLPYDCQELQRRAGEEVVSWNMNNELGRVLTLTDGEYFCPSCREYNLSFRKAHLMWD
jgi:hypothetical protein